MISLRDTNLATRLAIVMLSGLALSQGVSVLLSQQERGDVMNHAMKAEFLSRTALVAELLEATPPEFRRDILRASDTTYSRFWTSSHFPADTRLWRRDAYDRLSEPLVSIAGIAPGRGDASNERNKAHALTATSTAELRWSDLPEQAWQLSRAAKLLKLDDAQAMGLSVQLKDRSWLNSVIAKKVMTSLWTFQTLISLGVAGLVLTICALLIARGIAGPMRNLATAAEALGRGEAVRPLPEVGPRDIRQTAAAFNGMRERLQRFIEDRTRLLAAIGHDLRTPITTLRLRAEFVPDDENRERMLATLDELRAMTEATLTFAREDAAEEPTRSVDVGALVESLCEDLSELDLDVAVAQSAPVVCRCRPDALKRAVRNLVENAVRYGERARVSVRARAEAIDILVEDDGPGIPAEAMEAVFAPFFRLETSRNRETGGIGLGLSIARTIARHHGGNIHFTNTGTGLLAVLSLPNTEAHDSSDSLPMDKNAEPRGGWYPWRLRPLPAAAPRSGT
ncbi:signal transduction histidine kinase [Bosea sp. OAE752]|uniref:sensor histidine kinase n=1 Tax=Bosea sp. OAE752 TaxID=2663873 RepID=UPI003D1A97A5